MNATDVIKKKKIQPNGKTKSLILSPSVSVWNQTCMFLIF